MDHNFPHPFLDEKTAKKRFGYNIVSSYPQAVLLQMHHYWLFVYPIIPHPSWLDFRSHKNSITIPLRNLTTFPRNEKNQTPMQRHRAPMRGCQRPALMTTLLGPRKNSGNSMISSTQPIHMAQLMTFSWLRDSVPIGTVTVSLVVAVI